jgi:hypothetical protein
MKTLITGGAGFIGSNFIRYLLSSRTDYHIVHFDKLTYAGNLANLHDLSHDPRYTFIQGNICDPFAVAKAMSGCDSVVHFAAESHVDRSIFEPAAAIGTNLRGTFALLQAARESGIRRFVQISTDEVCGDLDAGTSATEASPLRPSSPYSASKAGADLLVLSFVRTYGFPGLITRSSNTELLLNAISIIILTNMPALSIRSMFTLKPVRLLPKRPRLPHKVGISTSYFLNRSAAMHGRAFRIAKEVSCGVHISNSASSEDSKTAWLLLALVTNGTASSSSSERPDHGRMAMEYAMNDD